MWSLPVYSFYRSKVIDNSTIMASTTVAVTVLNKEGNECISPSKYSLSSENTNPLIKIPLNIISDCLNPVVSVKLLDSKYGELDSKDFTVISSIPPAQPISKTIFLVVAIFGVIGLMITIIFFKRLKRVSVFPIVLLLIIFSAGVSKAKADTFSITTNVYGCTYPGGDGPVGVYFFSLPPDGTSDYGGGVYTNIDYAPYYSCNITPLPFTPATVTVSLDKSSYSPGATIIVNGTLNASYLVSGYWNNLTAQTSGNSSRTLVYIGTGATSGSTSFIAPSTPGSYSVSFTGCVNGAAFLSPSYILCSTYSYPFTVSAPVTPPTVQLYFSTLMNNIKKYE